jgi:hypothetical protein
VPRAGRQVDALPIIGADGASVRLHLRGMRLQDLPRTALLPFATLPFCGEPIEVPHAPEIVLERQFGTDWRIPDRFSRLHRIKGSVAAATRPIATDVGSVV